MTVQLPNAMKPARNNKEQKDRLREYASLIEKYFEAYSLISHVAEVNSDPLGIQFCLEIALGTPISGFEKYHKQLATVLASPKGKITMEAPIPGRYLIGITIPWIYPFADIPASETPDPDHEDIGLLKSSSYNFRLYQQIIGEKSIQEQSIVDEYIFLKNEFINLERKPDLRARVNIIEKTYESFGLPVKIVEVDCEPDHYLFKVKPEIEMEAKDIAKYHNDLALALSLPIDHVGITVPLPGGVLFGLSTTRVNYFGDVINANNAKKPIQIKGFFKKLRYGNLYKNSWDFFWRFEQKYRRSDRYMLTYEYAKLYHRKNNTQLVDTFNTDLGKTESARENASRLIVIQNEFDLRNIDYTEILIFSGGLSQRNKIILEGKKILKLEM